MALIVHMLRTGAFAEDDIASLADGLSEEARHLANCAIVEAAAPQETKGRAGQAQPRLHVVKRED